MANRRSFNRDEAVAIFTNYDAGTVSSDEEDDELE